MKTIALYGLQMLVGLVALAAGFAKLTGMPFLADAFATIGLGHMFLMLAGTAEILAGLCLLFPRSGAVGALLLTSVMVGTTGASIGAAITQKGEPQVQAMRTSAQPGVLPMVVIKKSQGWDI
jgi:uncharacterized membrane protein YphA (DoxX/SURF4 family)